MEIVLLFVQFIMVSRTSYTENIEGDRDLLKIFCFLRLVYSKINMSKCDKRNKFQEYYFTLENRCLN